MYGITDKKMFFVKLFKAIDIFVVFHWNRNFAFLPSPCMKYLEMVKKITN